MLSLVFLLNQYLLPSGATASSQSEVPAATEEELGDEVDEALDEEEAGAEGEEMAGNRETEETDRDIF